MPSINKNKCCREVKIIQEKLNENCITSTSSSNKLCLDTEVLMFSLIPACAVIATRKQFLEEDERYKGFHEANMLMLLDKSKEIKRCILNKMSIHQHNCLLFFCIRSSTGIKY